MNYKIDATKHIGDCSIYASLDNIGCPEAGICTCGAGHHHQQETGDDRHLYSPERREALLKEEKP